MATTKDYADFILEQLSLLDGIFCRKMMGEYLLYYQDRLFGGIYDNRLLVKPLKVVDTILPHAPKEIPYKGGKPMVLIEDVEDKLLLQKLITAMWEELPPPKPKKKKEK